MSRQMNRTRILVAIIIVLIVIVVSIIGYYLTQAPSGPGPGTTTKQLKVATILPGRTYDLIAPAYSSYHVMVMRLVFSPHGQQDETHRGLPDLIIVSE